MVAQFVDSGREERAVSISETVGEDGPVLHTTARRWSGEALERTARSGNKLRVDLRRCIDTVSVLGVVVVVFKMDRSKRGSAVNLKLDSIFYVLVEL